MISFRISAPGKVILFGEHAVVYNKTAVAASLNRRSFLDFEELPIDEKYIHLEMPKLQLSKRIPMDHINDALQINLGQELSDLGHDELHRRSRVIVEKIGYDDPRQKISLECFHYALLQMMAQEELWMIPFKASMDTELSIGAGVGSSASFSVCLVACFLRWSQIREHRPVLEKFNPEDLKKISRYAFNCEKIMHGIPSGIDNVICTFGSIIEFRKGEEPKFISTGPKSLRILLVDTMVGRSTKLLVQNLADLLAKYPEIFNRVIEAIDHVSKRAINIIEQIQSLQENHVYKGLSELIVVNQGLLATCQVSHSSLDLICLTANKYGFAAKLTGAGGGGFAYVLLPPNASNENTEKLCSDLVASGFSVAETNLGGSGVEIQKKI